MSVSVDPRFAARRRQVSETWARRRLRWLVALVGIVMVAGVGLAVLRSPWLAIRTVSVFGVDNADVATILAEQHVTPGVATVSVRPGALERSMESDPWVARADVRVTWPGAVEVLVFERAPAAWVESAAGWFLVAADGYALTAGDPPKGAPVVRSAVPSLTPGAMIEDAETVAAFEFLGLLPPELAVGASARVRKNGIEAEVAGYQVMLGNGRDMAAKVASLTAMMDQDLPPESVLNLISPSRPGVTNPQPVVEDTEEEVSSLDDSG